MKTLERAEKAAADYIDETSHGGKSDEDFISGLVHAVLMAVREPETKTRMIGRDVILNSGQSPCADYSVAVGMGFTAMIDAILAEGE